MINRNELRIGVCVKADNVVWSVAELKEEEVWLRRMGGYCEMAKYEDLEPISIEETILSDCGYNEINKGLWFDLLRNARFFIEDCKDYFKLEVYNMNNNPKGVKVCEAQIKYIHTLQMLVEMYQSIIDNESK